MSTCNLCNSQQTMFSQWEQSDNEIQTQRSRKPGNKNNNKDKNKNQRQNCSPVSNVSAPSSPQRHQSGVYETNRIFLQQDKVNYAFSEREDRVTGAATLTRMDGGQKVENRAVFWIESENAICFSCDVFGSPVLINRGLVNPIPALAPHLILLCWITVQM